VIKFCVICGVEREVPDDLIRGLAAAPAAVERALSAPGAAYDGWSPREVLAHLADSEVNFGARIRLIISEDEPLVTPYDQERWAEALRYRERDLDLDLATFRAGRASNVDLLRRLDAAAWQRPYVAGGASPARRTLEELVTHRADHDLQHLAQIASGGAAG
jgi:hypothetical protein